jgi:hypothetical protein
MNDILKLSDKMVVIDIEKKDDIDWAFERREEARLDAMYEARYAGEEDDDA